MTPDMKLIDLSQPVCADCPHCPLDPPVESQIISDHKPDGWRVEKLTLTPHTGSHIDAPLHRFARGASIDKIPIERFVSDAVIADLRECRAGQPFLSGR